MLSILAIAAALAVVVLVIWKIGRQTTISDNNPVLPFDATAIFDKVEVLQDIPGFGAGTGKVSLTYKGVDFELDAMTDYVPILKGARIKVVAVRNKLLVVEPA